MKKKNPERMRYINDSRSANLVFVSIGFDIAYFIALYANSSVVPNILIGIDVIINILFLLIAFWASEMVKVYDKRWSLGLVALAAVQFLRIFWVPGYYHDLGQLTGRSYIITWASLLLSGAFLLFAALNSYANSTTLENHLKKTVNKEEA